jgi:hypothetical protein
MRNVCVRSFSLAQAFTPAVTDQNIIPIFFRPLQGTQISDSATIFAIKPILAP